MHYFTRFLDQQIIFSLNLCAGRSWNRAPSHENIHYKVCRRWPCHWGRRQWQESEFHFECCWWLCCCCRPCGWKWLVQANDQLCAGEQKESGRADVGPAPAGGGDGGEHPVLLFYPFVSPFWIIDHDDNFLICEYPFSCHQLKLKYSTHKPGSRYMITFGLWIISCLILIFTFIFLSFVVIITYDHLHQLPPAASVGLLSHLHQNDRPPLHINPIIINHIANNLIDNISSLLRLLRAYSASSRRPGSRRQERKRARTWSR